MTSPGLTTDQLAEGTRQPGKKTGATGNQSTISQYHKVNRPTVKIFFLPSFPLQGAARLFNMLLLSFLIRLPSTTSFPFFILSTIINKSKIITGNSSTNCISFSARKIVAPNILLNALKCSILCCTEHDYFLTHPVQERGIINITTCSSYE